MLDTSSARSLRRLIDDTLSLSWCREHMVVPLSLDNNVLTLAIGNIEYLGTIGGVIRDKCRQNGYLFQTRESSIEDIQQLLDQAQSETLIYETEQHIPQDHDELNLAEIQLQEEAISDLLLAETGIEDIDWREITDEPDDALGVDIPNLNSDLVGEPVKQAVARMLIKAYKDGASDIHIEPYENDVRVRFRIDGVLKQFIRLPRIIGPRIAASLKVMAGLDVAERRVPQDGRILRLYNEQKIELRVSTLPVRHGEKVVMRLLNSNSEMLQLDSLITNQAVLSRLRQMIHLPFGIVIVAGPTGSGKSTTLYSAISEINDEGKNVVTAEDPIEYSLDGIQQVQVIREKGLNFAYILRAFMRQDPDVMLVGETRDPETAKTSMEAALTGHLVFTTIHANTSAASVSRLLEMGVESHLLTSSVIGILAQRLVRRVCPSCSSLAAITPDEAELSGLPQGTSVRVARELSADEKDSARRNGDLCPKCLGRGYAGRVGVYELMTMSNQLKSAIASGVTAQELEDLAVAEGMLTLRAYGVELVQQGLTTLKEAERVCFGSGEW